MSKRLGWAMCACLAGACLEPLVASDERDVGIGDGLRRRGSPRVSSPRRGARESEEERQR